MRLLFDENLSDKLIQKLNDLFPDFKHVKNLGLEKADDVTIWDWAKQNGYTIISKDTDFHQRAIVFGHPPKFIWLRVGNCSTSLIASLLRSRIDVIQTFIESKIESILILDRESS